MVNHRTLPYEGLHYSKKECRPGAISAALTTLASLMAGVIFLAVVYLATVHLSVPIRFTADGAPLYDVLRDGIFNLWS